MNQNNNKPSKFFYMNLKKNVSQGGVIYYTGKYTYAIEIVGFEKKDGSGDLTLWLQPKDMDQIKNARPQQTQRPSPQPARIKPRVIPNPQTQKTATCVVDHATPPSRDEPWPDHENDSDSELHF